MNASTPARRKLPIGIQTFTKIRSEDYYYVDKTPLAWRLTQAGSYYFLSRPRRFGKSLFLDTLKELFEGNEPLFRGLFIHDRWDWSVHHPVIALSFAGGVLQSRTELDEKIGELLEDQQQCHQVVCTHTSLSGRFEQLIRGTYQRTGQRVVVLIDEYDKPILDNLKDRETALAMREGLKNLYSVLKGADAYLRLVFLTGVSKFSKVSLFSGLNNLNDITVDAHYSAICGYTEADVDTVFAPELSGLDRKEIRHWYNGYHWLGEAVYNPFDLLLLFDKRQFRPWWFETGTPGFLIDLLAQRGFFTPNLARLRTGLELLSTFDVEHIATEALLFQTGYLTIHQAEEPIRGHWVYTLGYPNHEVETSLNASLLSVYTDDLSKSFAHRLRLLDLLLAHDLAGLQALFQAFFASIPHQWYDNNPISRYEGYYASVFYSYFAALGLDILLEDATNHGRIDMTVKLQGRIYLFEFKVVELTPEGRALQQLKDKGYAEKYRALGQPIHLIGVEFSRTSRNVVGFEVDIA
ncbi:MAG: ATP-binding protein, partial [Gammaproteobacteria bacterium]|nr:ATP-binding protein [Gammaproteobacteria bacterium]